MKSTAVKRRPGDKATVGGFLKWWYHSWMVFWREKPKMDDLGVPLFIRKPQNNGKMIV